MEEVLQFLTEHNPFYLATVEGDIPRVRPFGFVMLHQGKLYCSMANTKDVYRQLQLNPKVELSTTGADGATWLRVSGKAVFDSSMEVKIKALELFPPCGVSIAVRITRSSHCFY